MVPIRQHKVAIEVVQETEVPGGWLHTVRISRPESTTTTHDVRLAWVDHEYWCGGALPPSRVTAAVVDCLVGYEPIIELPPRFDASTARRWVPGIDDQLARVL